MTINPKVIQATIAYLAVVAGILTSTLNGVTLPPTASAILGIFGILLHPQTSITTPTPTPTSSNPIQ